ncbi:CoA transferase [Reyranella sp. CPCC 100927]|uniref:CoA transferase n=1 Tax=Reyranella sp. CPCC 100927 TaxID=2599616 RepID=UPI0011B3F385|nr:CoA transferase [Reyranella sp. CPCC 100927]TWT13965.1 CoA transferase [Reyranella sp. CPCC 100927]
MTATVDQILADLWQVAGGHAGALDDVTLSGAEPVLPSSFRVGAAAQASIAAATAAAAELWRLRTGRHQRVSVDMRHAAVEFRSERYLRVAGRPATELWDKIAGTYRCGDGRWVRLHTNFPHHRDGVLKLLDCAHDRDAVAKALSGWKAEAFEQAAADAGLVVAMMRSPAEWDAHPQGQALADLPLMRVEKIGDAPAGELPGDPQQPLSGVRVLDLTRIIAGPVCGRTLAAHGADVLNISGPGLPSVEPLVIDTGRGKRAAHIDLRTPEGRETLRTLVRGADVFVQGYRPNAIAGLGFDPATLAALRPGIVCVTLSAYGEAGPWADRRGFDSLVQTASGINHAEAQAAGITEPKPLPCQALDHASGYLLALGAMIALLRRAREGGSWHVRVSLAQTGRWIAGLGRLEAGLGGHDPGLEDVRDLLEESDSGFGRLTAVRHAGQLSETPPRWACPAVPLGTHRPVWAS